MTITHVHMTTHRRLILVLTLLFSQFSLSLFAQQDSLIPLKRIFFKPYIAGTRPNSPEISPDGTLILYRWDEHAENKYRFYLMNSDGTNAHQIADTLVSEVEWAPDSKTIACIRQGDIFLTDTSFRSFTRLTKTEAGERNLLWSKDGKLLIFSSDGKIVASEIGKNGWYEITQKTSDNVSINLIDLTFDGKKVILSEYDRQGLKEFIVPKYTGTDVTTNSFKAGISKTRFGIAPVDTGRTVWLQLPGDERFFTGDVAVAPDGKSVAIERFSSNRKLREIFVADTDSGRCTPVFNERDSAWVEAGGYTTRWMPDNTTIITTSEKDGWNHLYSVSADGKRVTKLTDGRWEIRWFDIHPAGQFIYFLANKDDHHQWQVYAYDVEKKSISKITSWEGTFENPQLSKDGTFIIAEYSDFAKPKELVRINTSSGMMMSDVMRQSSLSRRMITQQLLTNTVPDEFKKIEWVIPEIVHFKARDGTDVPAMIYKPKNFDPTRKYPVVVFVHGAGYLQNVYRGWSYYYREYMFNHRLTQLGFVVYEVEYRGSAGYGRKFRADVALHLGGKDLQDEIDGIDYLAGLGYIDAQRVGIYGGSYGGFMALMGLFLTDKYACGAALRAVTRWENYYRHNSWYTEARLGKPEDNPEAYKKSSPITFADSLKKPLLILHGMLDDNVFFQDAVQLIHKLQKAGKKFEVMMYPEEGHAYTEPESWYDQYSRIEEFFVKHLLQ
jgi:dipeptidyl aminopeptidase/acylaminoacyl peptidase